MGKATLFALLCISVCYVKINGDSLQNGTQYDLKQLDSLLKMYDRRSLPTGHLGGKHDTPQIAWENVVKSKKLAWKNRFNSRISRNNVSRPTVVSCEIYIRSFGSINPSTMDYEVDLYLRQSWEDGRLKASNLIRTLDLNDPTLVQRIWKPEVFFPNAKDAEFQKVTVPNILLRINPGGKILYMLRLKLIFSCMMDLYRFPFDSQVCTMELASFSKTTEELHLKWSKGNPVILFDYMKLPQFEIQRINTSLCRETFHIGEYSCLKAEFFLQRSIGHHLVQSYLPTALIVVISWVSFWLDVECIPARITLGVTTLLTITSKGAGIQSNLPPVSYVKAMDVWMGACTTFVFAAVIEFTFVNFLWRKHPKKSKTNCEISTTIQLEKLAEELIQASSDPFSSFSPDINRHKNQAKRIDRHCRLSFPLMFLIFNAAYWPYYMR